MSEKQGNAMSLSEAKSCFDAGDLATAIDKCQTILRQRPVDQQARRFLAELLCFDCNFERADKQLDILSTQEPDGAAGYIILRQVLRAAQVRQNFFHDVHLPTFVVAPDEHVRSLVRSLVAMRDGDTAEAVSALKHAETVRPVCTGGHGSQAFVDFRDADDRMAGIVEVLTTNGEYAWVPMSSIDKLEPRPIRRALDLLWRPAMLTVRQGPDGLVYLPCVYEPAGDNPQHVLGRETDWREVGDGIYRGFGLRTFIVDDDNVPILELAEMSFDQDSDVG